jgi:hypothetical protein
MPAGAVAVSGRARVMSSWLDLVEWLVVGADEEISGGVAPIAASSGWRVDLRLGELCGAVLGRAIRAPPERRWPPARSPIRRHWAKPPCS